MLTGRVVLVFRVGSEISPKLHHFRHQGGYLKKGVGANTVSIQIGGGYPLVILASF